MRVAAEPLPRSEQLEYVFDGPDPDGSMRIAWVALDVYDRAMDAPPVERAAMLDSARRAAKRNGRMDVFPDAAPSSRSRPERRRFGRGRRPATGRVAPRARGRRSRSTRRACARSSGDSDPGEPGEEPDDVAARRRAVVA